MFPVNLRAKAISAPSPCLYIDPNTRGRVMLHSVADASQYHLPWMDAFMHIASFTISICTRSSQMFVPAIQIRFYAEWERDDQPGRAGYDILARCSGEKLLVNFEFWWSTENRDDTQGLCNRSTRSASPRLRGHFNDGGSFYALNSSVNSSQTLHLMTVRGKEVTSQLAAVRRKGKNSISTDTNSIVVL